MPLHLATPFDPGDAPPGAVRAAQTPAFRRRFADLCFILVKAGAFLGAIYLMVLALPLAFFLLLSGGDMDLFFAQLGNLSAHYLAADHAGRASFVGVIRLGLIGLATLGVIWRVPKFLDEVSDALAQRGQAQ